MLIDNGGVVLANVHQDKEFGVAVGLAVELVKFRGGQQFAGKSGFIGHLAGHGLGALTAKVNHVDHLFLSSIQCSGNCGRGRVGGIRG